MTAKELKTLVTFLMFHLCLSLNDSIHGTPNIIIFLTESLSMKDLGFYYDNSQETPNIDSLIEEGVVFSRFYAQSSRIASLSSLLTGLLPPRTLNHGFDSWYGVASANKEPCMESYKTTSDSLYTWQSVCAFFSPLLYILPFVSFVGWYKGLANIVTVIIVIIAFIIYSSILHDIIHFTMDFIQVKSCVLYRNSNIIEQPYTVENLTLRFTRNAVQFLESSSISSKPFLLFFSFMNLNQPEFASRLFSNSSQSTYSDALKELDWSVGRILRVLKKRDLENNTLVLFLSATGHHVHKASESCSVVENGEREASCLQGGSVNGIWEQTIRVPAVMRWKGKLKEKQIIKTPVTIMDVVPTVLELLNESTEAVYLDGKSLLPVLLNSSAEFQHKYIFHYLDVTKPAAITSGSYKVLYTGVKDSRNLRFHEPPLLFNVEVDPEETSPLPNVEHRELLANFSDALAEHMKTRKNKWHSQLDSRIIPFLFPCANFPRCFQASDENNDFSELFN